MGNNNFCEAAPVDKANERMMTQSQARTASAVRINVPRKSIF
jgi:hypothetical protein